CSGIWSALVIKRTQQFLQAIGFWGNIIIMRGMPQPTKSSAKLAMIPRSDAIHARSEGEQLHDGDINKCKEQQNITTTTTTL
ncbi:unnamed protein product, partial [Ceratitis capitata]